MAASKIDRCIVCIHSSICDNDRQRHEDEYNDCSYFLHYDDIIHKRELAETLVEIEAELHRKLPHKPLPTNPADDRKYTENSFELGREKALYEAIGLLSTIWRKHLGGTNNES